MSINPTPTVHSPYGAPIMDTAERTASAWRRLQALSCEHASQLGKCGTRQHHVPEVIEENVHILGRMDEAELKQRVFWYITFHPAVFDACSKVWSK